MRIFEAFDMVLNEQIPEVKEEAPEVKEEAMDMIPEVEVPVVQEVVEPVDDTMFAFGHNVEEEDPPPMVVEVPKVEIDLSALQPPAERGYVFKGERYSLKFEGVCTSCAHCGMPLTDAVSIQRGLGPICSRKGYDAEDIKVTDDSEALIALAEYPDLVDWLMKKYKPQGNRGLVNGLVRTASLNRRTPVHSACTDAIEALGYRRLAGALRESLCVIELTDDKDDPTAYSMWIKNAEFNWAFYNALRRNNGVVTRKYPTKHTVVPKVHRVALARLLVEYYTGFCVRTTSGAHKISQSWFDRIN